MATNDMFTNYYKNVQIMLNGCSVVDTKWIEHVFDYVIRINKAMDTY